jgi:hypothetical protein
MTRSATELVANSGHMLDLRFFACLPVRHPLMSSLMVASLHAAALWATWHAVEEKLQQDSSGTPWHLTALSDYLC